MSITIEQLKNAVVDIKNDLYEGNDSHSIAEYRGASESLDMLLRHFEKVTANKIDVFNYVDEEENVEEYGKRLYIDISRLASDIEHKLEKDPNYKDYMIEIVGVKRWEN